MFLRVQFCSCRLPQCFICRLHNELNRVFGYCFYHVFKIFILYSFPIPFLAFLEELFQSFSSFQYFRYSFCEVLFFTEISNKQFSIFGFLKFEWLLLRLFSVQFCFHEFRMPAILVLFRKFSGCLSVARYSRFFSARQIIFQGSVSFSLKTFGVLTRPWNPFLNQKYPLDSFLVSANMHCRLVSFDTFIWQFV